ncbi:unnamed protein product [Owenia fusiformis]|uniref:Uncharacterized protein n=1 Tax=Owenia fusiformis TaxID=6347 RepID=A0A8S4PXJ4_OWEFU|nr:unnamed protein product [Owenia fusiformis]
MPPTLSKDEKLEQRAVIKFLQKTGGKPSDTIKEFKQAYASKERRPLCNCCKKMSETKGASVKLVTVQRFKFIPNLSPFSLALETFMRLANIQYEVEFTKTVTINKETGQVPFVIVNGVQVNDSQKIMSHLSEVFDVDLNSELNPIEKTISHAFVRMMNEFTSWTYFYWRYVDHPELIFPDIMDSPESFGISPDDPDKKQNWIDAARKKLLEQTHNQGVGRKSKEEIYKMGMDDLRGLSVYLGEKPFMFGDKASVVDCVLFGHLCQIVYLPLPTMPHKIMVENECKNLVAFCDRMKALAWPDWDKLTN